MFNSVGIDIGKENLDVYLDNKSYKFKNDTKGIEKLISKCNGKKVILEPSGGYERKLLKELVRNNISVSLVNPVYVRNFARSSRDLAKTDSIDAKMLAEYGEKMDPMPYNPKESYRFELEELNNRRCQIVEFIKEENNRLEKKPDDFVVKSIEKHIKFLKEEQKIVEESISKLVEEKASEEDKVLQSLKKE